MTNWLKKRMSIHTLVNLINQLFSLSSSLGKSFLSPIKIQKIDVLYGLVRMIIDSSINWTDFIFTVRCTSDFSINSLNQQIFLVETNNPLSQPINSSLSIHLYLIYSIISCFFSSSSIYIKICWIYIVFSVDIFLITMKYLHARSSLLSLWLKIKCIYIRSQSSDRYNFFSFIINCSAHIPKEFTSVHTCNFPIQLSQK